MKNIDFKKQILPHIIAVLAFLIVTIVFFNPIFFGSKKLDQHDILQWKGGAQEVIEYREKTGEEALWTNSMFGGMPAYLVDVDWNDGIVTSMKKIMGAFLPHPVINIFLCFISFYILLLAFKVRPYLAIAGAFAFGLSSFMIIGLGAGHNARIGAIAFMPLVIAGIHVAFTRHLILGFGLTAVALALELRENHLQITYYLALVVVIYGIIMLIDALKSNRIIDFAKTTGLLMVAALIAVGTFYGKFQTTLEYSQYSMRGKSELQNSTDAGEGKSGLKKDYAFQYSNGIFEPITLMIPDFYGGASSNYLAQDQDSESYKILQRADNPQMANQLARYTSAYWGNQPLTAPYYIGAIICLLFAIGVAFADRKYVIWLVAVAALGIILSWGDSFKAFNYFMFDYFPGYNKFRSVTFSLVMAVLAMPLLGMIGLERLLQTGLSKPAQKKLFIALGATGGLCLLIFILAGMAPFIKEGEEQLPGWFLSALQEDRESLMRMDALRSLVFIALGFASIFFHLKNKLSYTLMALILSVLVVADSWTVDKRYFGENNYKRDRDNSFFSMNEADKLIKKDPDLSYRVHNITSYTEARTSYYHQSLGGYHGAKLRRYQDLYDRCLGPETSSLIQNLQAGKADFSEYGIINMLNAKYLTFGPTAKSVIRNPNALGNAWFVGEIVKVNSPDEELSQTCEINPAQTAIVDASRFDTGNLTTAKGGSSIKLTKYEPNQLTYEAESNSGGLAVFSEIYYPEGWIAKVNGKPVDIIRANYVLRALQIPQGKSKIEFTFAPSSFNTGNTIMLVSSILLLLIFLGSIGWALKPGKPQPGSI